MRHRVAFACVLGGVLLFGGALVSADDDPSEIEKATRLLFEVSRVYSELPALTDEITTSFSMDGRADENSKISVRFSKHAAEATGIAPPQTLDIHVVDGRLYLQLNGVEGVVEAEIGDDPLASAKRVMGMAYPYLPPQIVLRWATGIDGVGEWFMMGMLEKGVVAGYAETGDGVQRPEVLFEGVAPLLGGRPGTCRVQFDSKTKLATSIVIEGGTDGSSPTFRMSAKFRPKITARLEEPIVLDVADDLARFAHFKAMLNVLLGGGVSVDPSIEVGAAAPTFDLLDQNGKRHTSDAYRGKVIVLDWWGVWCLACTRDMPKVQALHEKHANNPDVVILAMNVGDDNERMERYWGENNYTFAALHDADELADRFGIKAFPSVVLIGPDGGVVHVEAGSASDLDETLSEVLESIR